MPAHHPQTEGPSSVKPHEHAASVGKYHLLSELGRGGTATVYLAVARGQAGVSKLVVLKALLPDLAEEPSAVTMFLDEARLAAQLNHPNVVQTYEVGTEGDRSVIVMEYLEGQSLSRLVAQCEACGQRLTTALHLRILIDVLAGLHYAHELRSYDGAPLAIVHRDVSPQNVLVTYEGQVKILDFGIAKAASSTQTASGVTRGKLSYMAPEQMSGKNVDRRADIYAFGCMLWAAATRVKLWSDCSDGQIVRRVLGGRIPPPRSVNPDCPEELEAIVMKAVKLDPNERYATALELQADLEQFVETAGLVVKQRELGQLVSNLFDDARAELRARIEQQVAALRASNAEPPELEVSVLGEFVQTASTQTAPAPSSGTVSIRLGRGRTVALLVAAAALGSIVWLSLSAPPRTAPAAAPAASPASAKAAPPAAPATSGPATAEILFDVTPAQARVFVDGRRLDAGENPVTLPVGPEARSVRVEAEGHRGETRSLRVSGAETLRFVLTPEPPAVRRATSRAPAPSAGAASPAVTEVTDVAEGTENAEVTDVTEASVAEPAPRPSCENPLYVDEEGIKRVRPECQ